MRSCPRCKGRSLDDGRGAVSEDVCARCGGRFLPPEITERVVVDELGLERETLREIAGLFSGLRLPCPGCAALMRPLRLRGVLVDLCFSCGGLWLDAGELAALSGGRHVEIGADKGAGDVPVVVGRDAGVVALGRGSFVVLFDDDVAVEPDRLARVFARTDGLTSVDAQMLARHNHGVVVEGVSRGGADGLVAVLAAEGVAASAVDDAVLKLPPPLSAVSVDVDDRGLVARFHTGAPLAVAFADVAAAVAGRVFRERLERRAPAPSAWLRTTTASHGGETPDPGIELVSSEELLCELLVPGPPARRLRLPATPGLRAALRQKTATGRGLTSSDLPRYRRLRELERELAWVAWRAARWPVRESPP